MTPPAGVLLRLSQLCQAGQLRDVVQRNLFPSDRMIISLRKMFHTERREGQVHLGSEDDVPPPLDTRNREDIIEKVPPCKDLVQVWSFERFLKDSDLLELHLRVLFEGWLRCGGRALNGALSEMSSTVFLCSQTPGRRSTCCQQYQGATVEPEAPGGRCQSAAASVGEWSGSRRGDASRRLPKQPDEARVEELRKVPSLFLPLEGSVVCWGLKGFLSVATQPWTEDSLRANVLEPTLSRDIWPTDRHHLDFQLYLKPPPFFSPPVVAPHLSGRLGWATF